MNVKDYVEETGASYRQISTWVSNGLPLTENEVFGTGNARIYDPNTIPAVRLIVEVQRRLGGNVPVKILKQIFKNYSRRHLDFGDGLILVWRTDDGAYAPPGEGPTVPGQWQNFVRRHR